MTEVVHLVVGPEQHGVVLHGTQIATACGHRLVRVPDADALPDTGAADVVHLPYTDRLFGADIDSAAEHFRRIRDRVSASGASLSVTLHDVPHDTSPLQVRRMALYREVIAAVRGVVVNSSVELSMVEQFADPVHSLRAIPLPIVPAPAGRPAATNASGAATVAVLGYVYPDRGYEVVIDALPPRAHLTALGRAADGHDDLPDVYARLLAGRWTMTGYLSEEELATRLASVDVPVAPNRRVTASGSINSWLAHGRRPLVADSPYAREIAAARPGAIEIYDPDDAGQLRHAIVAAIENPASTWLGADVDRGPSLHEVAATYRQHLAACAPPRRVEVPGGWTVPGNRWDLLNGLEPEPPDVSVVIPYYDAQHQLDRVIAALAAQSHPLRRLEIVVADDGSPAPPTVRTAGEVTIRVVRQEDRGFRAAAARNLGAAAASGDVLVFLDADTVPDPDFIARLTRLPAVCPDAITVGRRKHADFTSTPPRPLAEPAWLREAYESSANLLHVDARSYRFVISAVLAMPRQLFQQLNGFDERFVGYGGEDWELAHRAWVAGAVFAHVPDAVAWHDGPDWSGRAEAARQGAKNHETLALATLLPDPEERGSGQWLPYPAAVVRVQQIDAAALLALARTAFATGADVGIWADDVRGPHADRVLADPRLHRGEPPDDIVTRARWFVDVDGNGDVDLSALPALLARADRHGEVVARHVRVQTARARRRTMRWWAADPQRWSQQLFGRHDASAPARSGGLDLAAVLRTC